VAVNGKRLSPAALLTKLNELGGANGVGRLDLVESRFVGMKSRGIYETPGGTIWSVAHRGIESITLDRGAMHLKDELMPRYAEIVYNGFWFSPERDMLQAAIDKSQRPKGRVASNRPSRCCARRKVSLAASSASRDPSIRWQSRRTLGRNSLKSRANASLSPAWARSMSCRIVASSTRAPLAKFRFRTLAIAGYPTQTLDLRGFGHPISQGRGIVDSVAT